MQFFEEQIRCIHEANVSASLIETFKVPFQGQKVELRFAATVYDDRGKVVVIPHDKSCVTNFAHILKEAGLNAYVFSKEQVVVSVPPRSGDQRQDTCARILRLAEESRVAIRNARKKAKQQHKGLSKDEMRDLEKELQEITDASIGEIDAMAEKKCGNLR